MADKELRRMNRTELIEIIYALEQDEQKLQEENDKLTAELEDRKIRLDQSGSIAEASLSLNHIFEDAQAAADQYLLSLQSLEKELKEPESEGQEEAAEPERSEETGNAGETEAAEEAEKKGEETEDVNVGADRILENARQQEQNILEEAHRQADQVIKEARKQADEITDEAHRQADEIVDDARRQADEYTAAAHENVEADAARQLEQTNEQCEKERQAVKEYHDKFMQDMSDVLKDNPKLLERVRQMGSAEGE